MSVRVGFLGWSRAPSDDDDAALSGRDVGVFNYMATQEGRVKRFVVGFVRYSASDLIVMRRKGLRLEARVFGVLKLSKDVTPHLARETIERASAWGWLVAGRDVKQALRR